MRKIVYSGALKFVAALLFIATVVSGVLVATNGVFAYFNQDEAPRNQYLLYEFYAPIGHNHNRHHDI